MHKAQLVLLLVLLSGLRAAELNAGESSGSEHVDAVDPALAVYNDPGPGPWEVVPANELIEVCGLDPALLAEVDATIGYPYALVRYGKLCHEFYPAPDGEAPEPAQLGELRENFSATKTLAAATVGRAARMSAGVAWQLSDEDRVDAWVGDISFNPDALVVDVLAMVGHNESLAFGERSFAYDAVGTVQINRLSDVVEAVIAQDPAYFGGTTTTGEFAERYLFEPLGMRESTWGGEIFAYSWASSLRDMARLGLLLVHEGVWDQRRLLDRAWVQKMTHPVYEDANTAYGYLTWLAASSHYYLPGIAQRVDQPLGGCQPSAIWPMYPRVLSEAPDCGTLPAFSCEQTFDVGVFAAVGFGGQLIVGHRALDLVIVAKDAGNFAFITTPWDAIRGALIEHDPVYAGDGPGFCAAYAAGSHAPDLIEPVVVPEPSRLMAGLAATVTLLALGSRRAGLSSGARCRSRSSAGKFWPCWRRAPPG